MAYNYAKLLGRIVEKYQTRYNFAQAMGLSEVSVSRKLKSQVQWKQNEIKKACTLLDITDRDIYKYFFASEVQY